jgi:hypothetical protein
MARLDIEEYRRKYLGVIEEKLLSQHEGIEHFSPQLLSDAIRAELNRVNPETWKIDVSDDFDQAVCEAEERIINTIEGSEDLGYGHGSVVGLG